MNYEHIFYTTSDGLLDVEFFFLDLGEELGWRAYVLSDINYKRFSSTRSDAYEDTHLFIESDRNRYINPNRDYPYVCWTTVIRDLDTMKTVASTWAEITSYYISHGGTFESIQKIITKKPSTVIKERYTTRDASLSINFLFVNNGALGWRVYIIDNINYRGRATSCHVTHRLTEQDPRKIALVRSFRLSSRTASPVHYICWTGRLESLEDARKLAHAWSEITAYYIRRGGSFSSIQSKLIAQGII